MKKQGIFGLLAVFALTVMLSGCKIIGDVEYTIEQNPVEMHGDSVRINITVKIPEKGLAKKASAEITPKLGDKAFKSVAMQGEKAAGNGQTIPKKTGGTVNYRDVIAYSPDMEYADLTVSGTATKGKKEIEIPVTKIADGTNVTPLWVQNDDKALIGADAFVRTTEKTYDLAQINYLKGKHDVRSTELTDKDIKALTEWLKAAETNPKIEPKKVNLPAYASPEGETAKNGELANDRAKTGQEAMDKIVKNAKFTAALTYSQQPKGEDWTGFKSAMEASKMEDRDQILRILQMYSDPEQREKEIRNLAATYQKLEKEILPSLRRTQLLVVYDHVGWSDDELKQLSKTKPDTLTIEELLFTAMARRHPHPRSSRQPALRCVQIATDARLGRRGRHCGAHALLAAHRRHEPRRLRIAAVTRKTSFYYSFLVLPAPQRQAITAVFDFCRAVDDAVDLESDERHARAAIGLWRREVAAVFDPGTPETPQGQALQPFVKPFHLPREQFDALVDGVEMDASPRRYQTFEELEPYCHRVASAVGLMCAEIFGYREQGVLDYARDLGVALQLTNILRDVAVDYRIGRMYLPIEDLARFGCTEDDVRAEVEQAAQGVRSTAQAGQGVRSQKLRSVLEHQATRARVFFSRATRALPSIDARRFIAAEIMRAIYFDLLERIERAQFDVFTEVIRVPRPRQAQLAARIWWTLR